MERPNNEGDHQLSVEPLAVGELDSPVRIAGYDQPETHSVVYYVMISLKHIVVYCEMISLIHILDHECKLWPCSQCMTKSVALEVQ